MYSSKRASTLRARPLSERIVFQINDQNLHAADSRRKRQQNQRDKKTQKVCITRRDAYLGHRLYPWVFSAFSSCDLVAENILLRPRRCVLHANFYDDDLERIQNFSLKHSRALFCVFEKIAHRGQKTEKYQHRVNKNRNRMKNK